MAHSVQSLCCCTFLKSYICRYHSTLFSKGDALFQQKGISSNLSGPSLREKATSTGGRQRKDSGFAEQKDKMYMLLAFATLKNQGL